MKIHRGESHRTRRADIEPSAKGTVGAGRKKGLADSLNRTPPRKIRAQFRGHKHTSLTSFVDEASETSRLLRSENKVRNVVVTSGRRQWILQIESLPTRCRFVPNSR